MKYVLLIAMTLSLSAAENQKQTLSEIARSAQPLKIWGKYIAYRCPAPEPAVVSLTAKPGREIGMKNSYKNEKTLVQITGFQPIPSWNYDEIWVNSDETLQGHPDKLAMFATEEEASEQLDLLF